MGNSEETKKRGTLKILDAIPENSISFTHGGAENKEILRFTEDKMFLYGKETECPEDIIKGMRAWLTQHGYTELVEKAQKYDELIEKLNLVLQYFDKSGNKEIQAIIIDRLGGIYLNRNNYKKLLVLDNNGS